MERRGGRCVALRSAGERSKEWDGTAKVRLRPPDDNTTEGLWNNKTTDLTYL